LSLRLGFVVGGVVFGLMVGVAGAQAVETPKTPESSTPAAGAPTGKTTPPVLESGQTTLTVDGKLTDAQEKDILASEQEIFQFVSKDTGLPMQKPVKCVFVSRDAVNKELRKKFDEDKSNKRMERSELVLKKFGLIDQDFQLRPFLLSLLTEQIAGFYDNKTKEMTLLDWVPLDEQKPVMAHELTHALQDLRMGLTKWEDPEPEGMAKNVAEDNLHVHTDEAGTSREAVLEGQAMVTFADYALESLGYKGKTIRDVPEMVEKLIAGAGDQKDSPVLARAPLVLQESLLFPYTSGLKFEADVLNAAGTERAFAGVLDAPPNTSAEILHPGDYLKKVQEPLLRLPDLHPLLTKDGWEPYDVGVMGELDVRMTAELFGGKPLANRLAAQWAGGVYYAAQKKDASAAEKATTKSIAILYAQRFKKPGAARKFMQVFAQELPRQYSGLAERKTDETGADELVYSTGEGDVLLKLEGNEVWVSEGFPLAQARELRGMVEEANPMGAGPVMQAESRQQGTEKREQGLVEGLGEWMGRFGVVKVALGIGTGPYNR
jgi:hypothetical protein